jgi:hypothetical protein
MTELTNDEIRAAVERMKRDDWSDEDRQQVIRLPANERDMIMLIAALLDGHPEEEA